MDRKVFVCILLALLVAVGAMAADIDGKWTAKMQFRGGPKGGEKGPQEFVMTFEFKANGDKLTGTLSGPMGSPVEISEGKIQGDNISFKVTREFQGRSMVMLYKGKVSGDEIKFTQTVEGVDRPPREFTAQRVK